MTRSEAVEYYHPFFNLLAKKRLVFHGKYAMFDSNQVKSSMKIKGDPIQGYMEYIPGNLPDEDTVVNGSLEKCEPLNFLKHTRTEAFALVMPHEILSLFSNVPKRKLKECACKFAISKNLLAVSLLEGTIEIKSLKIKINNKNNAVSKEIEVSAFWSDKILTQLAKNCARIGLRLQDESLTFSYKGKRGDVIWVIPSI